MVSTTRRSSSRSRRTRSGDGATTPAALASAATADNDDNKRNNKRARRTRSKTRSLQQQQAEKEKEKPTHSSTMTMTPTSKTNMMAAAAAADAPPQEGGRQQLLFSLMDDNHQEPLVPATLIARPSTRNRSPYVADVALIDDNDDDAKTTKNGTALAHVPNLDMGGKCVPGAKLLLKHARDRNGTKVGPDAVNPKYNTPKCEFHLQLLYVDEMALCTGASGRERSNLYPPTWVGAHPSLGERIARIWLQNNRLQDIIPDIVHVQNQVTYKHALDDGNNDPQQTMRADFCVTHADGTRRLVEVKTVVDTDYHPLYIPKSEPPSPNNKKKKQQRQRCVFTSNHDDGTDEDRPYRRTAIFPWGSGNQKGPNNEKVVSARAIHHVRALTQLVQQKQKKNTSRDESNVGKKQKKKPPRTKKTKESSRQEDDEALPPPDDRDDYTAATILFVVVRNDAYAFRPNHEACPSFARYLRQAQDAGVQVIAKKVEFDEIGQCFDSDDTLPIHWPSIQDDDDDP